MSNILSGLEGVLCLIDDVLVFGNDKNEHDERLAAALTLIKEAIVILNISKCEFEKSKFKFLGDMIHADGIRADPNKTSALQNMVRYPPPNVSELRRFMGMINQMGKFSSKLTEISQPLRLLLIKQTAWAWGHDQEKAFTDLKEELSRPTILALYNPLAATKVSADASAYGFGAVFNTRRQIHVEASCLCLQVNA